MTELFPQSRPPSKDTEPGAGEPTMAPRRRFRLIGGSRATDAVVAGTVDAGAVDDPEFATVFLERFTPLVRLATLLGADDPEDVVQEAFVQVYGKWDSLRDRGGLGAYLTTAVINRTRSRHRRLAVARRHAPLPDPRPEHPEDRVLARAEHQEVLQALGRLAPRHREALVLRFWLDYSEKQIAQTMGVAVGTAKSSVSRGLSALRDALPADFPAKDLP